MNACTKSFCSSDPFSRIDWRASSTEAAGAPQLSPRWAAGLIRLPPLSLRAVAATSERSDRRESPASESATTADRCSVMDLTSSKSAEARSEPGSTSAVDGTGCTGTVRIGVDGGDDPTRTSTYGEPHSRGGRGVPGRGTLCESTCRSDARTGLAGTEPKAELRTPRIADRS